MSKRMLIDASHPEETRVVVLDGQKVEEFDFESAAKRPLKGNIYLAKVTRVEPSLQAAFVEYGGNRQGFLAFSEIHPDYYQIPVSDRQALLAEAEAEARRRQEDDFESFDITPGEKLEADDDAEENPEAGEERNGAEALIGLHDDSTASGVEFGITAPGADDTAEDVAQEPADDISAPAEVGDDTAQPESADAAHTESTAETTGEASGDMALAAQRPSQRWMKKRHYKIQEVIKRRQIILVQVVKEERGNKGAALTTYLSLAGRYCVLMPNTPRGGGISRKITNAADRKRLKTAAQSLNLPEGMGLIIRTAGGNRTKVEIKRDYEYLLRMWDTIREQTLQSVAPSCVYEEGDLVKRAIRDLYNKDVDEVLVEGDAGYRNAKDFMRMLMPSHAKNVKPYKEMVPLFQRFHIEAQLDAMFSPIVTLKSGGYIVINQTEALVAIDVNSGRATKEHSIEETATKTNLEAADEIGRQLRLRDLAGLVVVDFIDMEDSRNDRLVEKRMMNAVKNDRARIQVGKISQFGLLEMSRQRLRAGVVASSSLPCPHCGGTGLVRSVESTSLRVLRGIEEEAQKQRADGLLVHVASEVLIYTLNQKRAEIARMESEYDITINIEPREDLKAGDFTVDRIGQRDPESHPRPVVTIDTVVPQDEEPEVEEEDIVEETAETETSANDGETVSEGEGDNRRRRRRRRRGRRGGDRERGEHENAPAPNGSDPAEAGTEEEGAAESDAESGEASADSAREGEGEGDGRRRRRRRRRGRRGGRDRNNQTAGAEPEGSDEVVADDEPAAVHPVDEMSYEAPEPQATPAVSYYEDRFGRVDEIDTTPLPPTPVRVASPLVTAAPVAAPVSLTDPDTTPLQASQPVWSLTTEEPAPVAPQASVQAPVAPAVVLQTPPPAAPVAPVADTPSQPAKKGWWQRTFRQE